MYQSLRKAENKIEASPFKEQVFTKNVCDFAENKFIVHSTNISILTLLYQRQFNHIHFQTKQ